MPQSTTIPFEKYGHITAETLCAELLANGFAANQLRISKTGAAKKLFRVDIDKLKVGQDNDGGQQVDIGINRDGIYDVLPEGLFHQPLAGNTNMDTAKMVADSRRLKEEEKQARLFFQPFDQELLLAATEVEQQERHLMQQILWGNMTGDPYQFWGIPSHIPKEQASMLTGILPWAYLIKGNMELTAKALQMVLGKPVNIEQKNLEQHALTNTQPLLEETILGEDSILGTEYLEEGLAWIITIESIAAAEMQLFANGYWATLVSLFTDIFVPVEIDVLFEYETNKNETATADNILGYGFSI